MLGGRTFGSLNFKKISRRVSILTMTDKAPQNASLKHKTKQKKRGSNSRPFCSMKTASQPFLPPNCFAGVLRFDS